MIPDFRNEPDVENVQKPLVQISLADAFAAALAKSKRAHLVTGDPEFETMEKEIKITWLK